MKSRLLLLLLTFTLLSSCAISNRLSIGDSRYLDVILMHQLSDNAILAAGNGKTNFEDGVKIITFGEHYSLGEEIRGNFICVDYYTYRTVVGTYNTVPVVVKESNYEKYKKEY